MTDKVDKFKSTFNLLNIEMGISLFQKARIGINSLSYAMEKAGGSFTKFTSLFNNLSNNGFKKFEDGLVKIVYPLSFFQAKMRVVSDSLKKDGDKFGGTLFGLGSKVSAGFLNMTVGVGKAEAATKTILNRLATHLDNFVGKAISFKKVLAESWAESLWSSDMYKEIETVKKKLTDYDKMVEELAKKKEQYANLLSNSKNKLVTFEDIEEEHRLYNEISNLEIKVEELKPKMDELRQTLTEIPKGLKLFGHEVLNVVKHLGVFLVKLASLQIMLAALVLLFKSFKWTNQIAQLNDEINDNAEKVNMTTDQYQKWGFVMKIAGSDVSNLRGHINQLNQRLKGADQESAKATKGFERLGISVYDANGEFRDSTELFEEAISKLQKIENTTTRAAIATQIFGKNASELNGLLNMNAQQIERINRIQNTLGLTANKAAIELAGAYNDAKDVFNSVFNAMKTTISEIMLPWLTKLIKTLIIAITYINIFVRTIFGLKDNKSTEKQNKSMTSLGDSTKKTTDKVKELKRQLLGFDELNVLQKDETSSSESADMDNEDFKFDTGADDTLSFLSDDELDRIDQFRKKIEELQGTLQVVTSIGLILAGLFLIIFAFFGGGIAALISGVVCIGLGIAIGNAEGEDGESAFDKIGKAISGFAERIKENALAIAAILVGIFLIIKGIMWSSTVAVIAGCSLLALGVLGLKNDEGETVFDQIANKMGMSSEQLKTLAINIAFIVAGLFLVIKGLMGWGAPAIIAGAVLIGIGVLTMEDSEGNTVFDQILTKMQDFLLQYQGIIAGFGIFFGLIALLIGFFSGNIPLIVGGAALIGIAILAGLQEDENGVSLFDKLIESGNKFIIDHQALIAGLSMFFGLIALIAGIFMFNPALIIGGAALIGVGVLAGLQVDENGESLFDKLGTKIKTAFTNIVEWFNANVAKVFTLEFWEEKFSHIYEAWDNALNAIWEKISDFATKIIEKIKDMCENIADKIKNLFSSEKEESEKELEETQRKLKQSQQQLYKQNKTGNNAKIATKQLQQSTRMMANLQVPKLATGGVATKPTLVQIGEYSSAKSNPEIVTPQSLMAETMQSANMEVVNAIYAIGNQISKTVEEKDTDIYMDGDKMTRKITKKQKEQSKYSSPSLVMV